MRNSTLQVVLKCNNETFYIFKYKELTFIIAGHHLCNLPVNSFQGANFQSPRKKLSMGVFFKDPEHIFHRKHLPLLIYHQKKTGIELRLTERRESGKVIHINSGEKKAES